MLNAARVDDGERVGAVNRTCFDHRWEVGDVIEMGMSQQNRIDITIVEVRPCESVSDYGVAVNEKTTLGVLNQRVNILTL